MQTMVHPVPFTKPSLQILDFFLKEATCLRDETLIVAAAFLNQQGRGMS